MPGGTLTTPVSGSKKGTGEPTGAPGIDEAGVLTAKVALPPTPKVADEPATVSFVKTLRAFELPVAPLIPVTESGSAFGKTRL